MKFSIVTLATAVPALAEWLLFLLILGSLCWNKLTATSLNFRVKALLAMNLVTNRAWVGSETDGWLLMGCSSASDWTLSRALAFDDSSSWASLIWFETKSELEQPVKKSHHLVI
ncbi:hypothetical protein FVEG_07749 [Fusarium verticillioides 7600]|uniref:Uncharacterized protein n=1 Tax=Gibberella moniliformis (strain M3125 / FGSC 7600) TaxID=334819 RepID=W7M9L9_GIBM7|nr:hypothetical protein FVEG_07749 [Fusarium verticillioides 7600]EWG47696.1 hypothetical protein FVEG_07749 [Fusarium verticillioides 7600]